ncbi:alpha/beta fold hydrolase [Aeromicrobium sp.]|uniref:alpha/beta fold hydrolase n=1 Tax=Aeromicrobium sp. TaxID=1871063 RepID=UPI002FCA3191
MRTTSNTVPVGDIEIACTIVGEGAPLVVLHGAIGLGSAYMRALDSWGDELQLIHYDQRGSGNTPVGDVERVTFAGAVDDLEGLRQALGLERIRVLGHSAGAYLAALYAAEHPETTAGVVLLNPGPPLAPELMEQFGTTMSSRRTPSDDAERQAIEESEEFRTGRPEALERHQLNTFIPFFRERATVDRVSLGFTEITAANVRQMPRRMMGSLRAVDPIRKFTGIDAPTLVVHAELDPIPPEWSRFLAASIPKADFALIEGGSHFPMVEDAEQLRSTVVPWLSKHC